MLPNYLRRGSAFQEAGKILSRSVIITATCCKPIAHICVGTQRQLKSIAKIFAPTLTTKALLATPLSRLYILMRLLLRPHFRSSSNYQTTRAHTERIRSSSFMEYDKREHNPPRQLMSSKVPY